MRESYEDDVCTSEPRKSSARSCSAVGARVELMCEIERVEGRR